MKKRIEAWEERITKERMKQLWETVLMKFEDHVKDAQWSFENHLVGELSYSVCAAILKVHGQDNRTALFMDMLKHPSTMAKESIAKGRKPMARGWWKHDDKAGREKFIKDRIEAHDKKN